MRDPTDPLSKYAAALQSNAEHETYTNEFKRQQLNKKRFIQESVSKSMSSSIPSYTFDQVFFFNRNTKPSDSLEHEFELDQTFMNIDTDYKTIGLREIRMTPDSFPLKFSFYWEKNGTTAGTYTMLSSVLYDIQVTAANGLEEILDNLVTKVNNDIKDDFLKYVYNTETRQVKFWTDKVDTRDALNHFYQFKFVHVGVSDLPRYQNLGRLLNFPVEKLAYVQAPKSEFVFDNVWDRRNLFIHSSIANTTPYNYLGHDNEFYEIPSKLYKWTSKSKSFRVWVSVNGETPVKLYWQPFLLQLQLSASCHR
jgi:hypothetical protein